MQDICCELVDVGEFMAITANVSFLSFVDCFDKGFTVRYDDEIDSYNEVAEITERKAASNSRPKRSISFPLAGVSCWRM